jgi:hypothetical protein
MSHAGEQLVVLNSAEAEILARALDEMQDWCKTNSDLFWKTHTTRKKMILLPDC